MKLVDAVPPPPAIPPGDTVGKWAEEEMELVREGVVAPEGVPPPPELPPIEKVPPVDGVESPLAVVGVAPPPKEGVDPAAKEGV